MKRGRESLNWLQVATSLLACGPWVAASFSRFLLLLRRHYIDTYLEWLAGFRSLMTSFFSDYSKRCGRLVQIVSAHAAKLAANGGGNVTVGWRYRNSLSVDKVHCPRHAEPSSFQYPSARCWAPSVQRDASLNMNRTDTPAQWRTRLGTSHCMLLLECCSRRRHITSSIYHSHTDLHITISFMQFSGLSSVYYYTYLLAVKVMW